MNPEYTLMQTYPTSISESSCKSRVYIQDLCKGGEADGRGEITKVMELGAWGILF